MKELDAHLLAVGETTGWADVVRERARQLMQSQPELSCKQLIDGVTAEIWAGWVEVPPVAKRCPLDVVSLGKRKRAGKFLPSPIARLLQERYRGLGPTVDGRENVGQR